MEEIITNPKNNLPYTGIDDLIKDLVANTKLGKDKLAYIVAGVNKGLGEEYSKAKALEMLYQEIEEVRMPDLPTYYPTITWRVLLEEAEKRQVIRT
jgi:hypothetical protein